jgi:quinol monooxygenase YgiN
MIFIVVKFDVKPEFVDTFMDRVATFTESTRAEPGNKFFEWSRSVENSNEYVLVEGFSEDAAAAHVNSKHFKDGLEAMRPALAHTPRIISRAIEGEDWDAMGELQID